MIIEYHRPQTIEEALALIGRSSPKTLPLGGGTFLSRAATLLGPGPTTESVEVVDLQALGLNSLKRNGNNLEIGATVTLQGLLEDANCPATLKSALKLEAPLNIRNAATVAGTIVTCDGRSTFATALLALDAKLTIDRRPKTDNGPSSTVYGLGEFLPLRTQYLTGKLITKIEIPLNIKLAFEFVSRTPADKPIVCAALAQWNSGRTRLTLGGYGKSPLLAMDGPHPFLSPSGRGTEGEGIEAAARNAFHEAKDDWASAEYRQDAAATLAKRCIRDLEKYE